MDLHLNGKTALVTASTGGIGLQIARTLAAEIIRVVSLSVTIRTRRPSEIIDRFEGVVHLAPPTDE